MKTENGHRLALESDVIDLRSENTRLRLRVTEAQTIGMFLGAGLALTVLVTVALVAIAAGWMS